MLLLTHRGAYEVGERHMRATLDALGTMVRGRIFAVERGGRVSLVDEPYSADAVLRYEADGYRCHYRK